MAELKKVAILINGGDTPGLNAVIRSIAKAAEQNGVECYGFIEGYKGLFENNFIKLDSKEISGILPRGGAIIGSSLNTNVFNYKIVEDGKVTYKDMSDKCVQNIKEDGFDCIFTLGGDSTQKSARDLSVKGVNIIGVPKTMDNDVACTEVAVGFNTAVSVAVEALDRLHTTAETHNRVMVLEVMGRHAGWLALAAAIAGGADVALLPEIPYDIEKVVKKIKERQSKGKKFSVVVVSEGAFPKGGEIVVKTTREGGAGVINAQLGGIGEIVAKQIEEKTGKITRNTTLGYLQRGGMPTAEDRILAARYGVKAFEFAMEGKFNILTVLKNGKLDCVSLEDVVGNNKKIGAVEGGTKDSNMKVVGLDDDLIKTARNLGICLGD